MFCFSLPLAAVRARSSVPGRVQVVDPKRGHVVVSVCCGLGNKLSELLSPSERSGHSSRPTLCTVVPLFLLLKNEEAKFEIGGLFPETKGIKKIRTLSVIKDGDSRH
ncbi:hypothetical protein SADUNF_Sadunf07G0040900 [Salix dunnii]|uniref:Uncharacterized protein n=1 Tax=Salix dunnii TaxID=1413687 RepID=A0A835JW12_9ROSI|nr:hypothetical protein SADUNF_Sadunf07G0040900 [Salix dunnii]